MNAEIQVAQRGKVAVITVHNPERRNSLTLDLSAELAAAVRRAEGDESVHAVVVTGAPPAFCAGADLTSLGEANEEGLRAIYAGFLAVADCTLPTVAAVGGWAVGAGLNLALAADVRLAGPQAKFDARFLKLGIHPGGGMTWMLQRAVGPAVARSMVLFSEQLDAAEAERVGLVRRVVDGDHDALVDAAVELAARAGDAPRDLVITTKRSMRTTSGITEHADAVRTELTPQLKAITSKEFLARLGITKSQISGRHS